MRLPTAIALTITLGFTGGCATDKHFYTSDGKCLTCWNNPVTGEPINHDGSANEVTKETAQETDVEKLRTESEVKNPVGHTVSFTVPVNVDLSFLKIKKEYNYYTEQETRQEWGSMANAKMQTFAYSYDAMPSVYYQMRAARNHGNDRVVIEHKIEKVDSNKTDITLTYWLDNPKVNVAAFGKSLEKRTKKALGL